MLFPTHLLVAYVAGKRWDLAPGWMVAGAALPDVVDKPLAMVDVFDLYHTAGHSALFLVGGAVVILAGRAGLALWAGWLSHLVLDAVHMVLNGRPDDVLFLAWPVVGHEPSVQLGPLEFFVHYLGTPSFLVEVAIWVAVLAGVVIRNRA